MHFSDSNDSFIQEYLYIEEMPPLLPMEEQKQEVKDDRGIIIIIDLFSDED